MINKWDVSRDRIADCLILTAFFFCFSFNHLALAKLHYLLGQISTYFIFAAVLIRPPNIPKNPRIFLMVFGGYCLISAYTLCIFGDGICSTRPFTGVINLAFVALAIIAISERVKNSDIFLRSIEKMFVASALAIIFLAIPDLYAVLDGDITNSFFEKDFFKYYGGRIYDAPRIRGFTQEPSYFGMVISIIYPIILIRMIDKPNALNVFIVTGLWICLIASFSRTGIITCFLLTLGITGTNLKNLTIFAIILCILLLVLYLVPAFNQLVMLRLGFRYAETELVERSSFTRIGLSYASIKLWFSTWTRFLFGVGLGQSGYLLADYFPLWLWRSPEAIHWAEKSRIGGTPIFSFLPRLLCELGIFGVVVISFKLIKLFHSVRKYWRYSKEIRLYSWSFFGFLIASFGVDGYLYLAAWMVLGVIIGCVMRLISLKSLSTPLEVLPSM